MTTDDINVMTISIMDKDGNGYISNIKKEHIPLIISILGNGNPFVKVDGLNLVQLKDLQKP